MYEVNRPYHIDISEEARSGRKLSRKTGYVESTRIVNGNDANNISIMRSMIDECNDVGYLPFVEVNNRMFLTVTHKKLYKFNYKDIYVFVKEDGKLLCYPDDHLPYDPRPLQQEASALMKLTNNEKEKELIWDVVVHQTKLPKKVLDRFEKIKIKIKK